MRVGRIGLAIVGVVLACGGDRTTGTAPNPLPLANYVGTYTLQAVDGSALPWIFSPGSTVSPLMVQSGVLVIGADSSIEYTQVGGPANSVNQFQLTTTVLTNKWAADGVNAIALQGISNVKLQGNTVSWTGAAISLAGAGAGTTHSPVFVLSR